MHIYAFLSRPVAVGHSASEADHAANAWHRKPTICQCMLMPARPCRFPTCEGHTHTRSYQN